MQRRLPAGRRNLSRSCRSFRARWRSRQPGAGALRLRTDADFDSSQSRCGRRRTPDRNGQRHRDAGRAAISKSCSRPRTPRSAASSKRHLIVTRDCILQLLPSPMQKGASAAGGGWFRGSRLGAYAAPVETVSGAATAAFTIARVEPEAMSGGRIQLLTHHTEQAVWQERWLKHPNSAVGLIDVIIAVADVEEAAHALPASPAARRRATPGGALIRLDRGGVYLVTHDRVTERLPEVAIRRASFHGRLCALRVNPSPRPKPPSITPILNGARSTTE